MIDPGIAAPLHRFSSLGFGSSGIDVRRLLYYSNPNRLRLAVQFRALRRRYFGVLWREAAASLGADCEDWGHGLLRIRRKDLCTFVLDHAVKLDDSLTLKLAGDKALSYRLYEELGFTPPKHCVFSMENLVEAEDFLRSEGRPVVIKPAARTGGGRGVTTGVTDLAGLRRAAREATRLGHRLLAETTLCGQSFRLLFLEGRFLDAVRRDPPMLQGNGRDSVRRLIRRENLRRLNEEPVSALSPLTLDGECRRELEEQYLKASSKPALSLAFRVKAVVNENRASENHNVRDQVHPSVISMASNLVKAMGVSLAGVDVITPDISRPLSECGGSICEINTTPGIHHHYLIADRSNGAPVAEMLLEHLLDREHGAISLTAFRE